MRRITRLNAPLAAALLLSGCFTYVPTQLSTVPAGEDVRVHLTRRAVVELSELSPQIQEALTGTLVGTNGDRVTLRVPVAARQEGFFRSPILQDIPVPTSEILSVERREFSSARTGLFVAGGAGVAAIIIGMIISGSDSPDADPGPGEEEIRIPFFSIPVR